MLLDKDHKDCRLQYKQFSREAIMEFGQEKYLDLLFGKYPSAEAICQEIINLNVLLNKPRKQISYLENEEFQERRKQL